MNAVLQFLAIFRNSSSRSAETWRCANIFQMVLQFCVDCISRRARKVCGQRQPGCGEKAHFQWSGHQCNKQGAVLFCFSLLFPICTTHTDTINKQDGETALMEAVYKGSVSTVKWLLSNGAQNGVNMKGCVLRVAVFLRVVCSCCCFLNNKHR